MTAPIPLDEMSEKALARVAVPHMSRYRSSSRRLISFELCRQWMVDLAVQPSRLLPCRLLVNLSQLFYEREKAARASAGTRS